MSRLKSGHVACDQADDGPRIFDLFSSLSHLLHEDGLRWPLSDAGYVACLSEQEQLDFEALLTAMHL